VTLRNGIRTPARKAVRALPDGLYLRLRFLLVMKRIPHLRNPRTFSEVIQWLKLHGDLARYAPYADKYQVREYVARTIGSQYLIPLIGVWDEFDQIPWDDLPQQFVLKATHGCGDNFVCRDKSAADPAQVRQAVTKWMSANFYYEHRESQYRNIVPRLIAEAYLEDDSGDLRDYKFSCFDGVPFLLEVMSNRGPGLTVNLYDPQWNLLPVNSRGYSNSLKPLTRPALFDDMLDAVAKLSARFPLVRVDLYYVAEKIYFGELTFTPANGFITYEPKSFNQELRRVLDLSKLTVGPQQVSHPIRAKLSLGQIKSLARARR
jgi:TupA-like ATPgrasp